MTTDIGPAQAIVSESGLAGASCVPTGPLRLIVSGPIGLNVEANAQSRIDRYRVLCTPLLAPAVPDDAALGDLRRAAPHATAAIDAVADDLALVRLLGARCFVVPPLLLVGPPGSGKTWLARQLALFACGPATLVYSLAGLNSAVPLKGQPRAFNGSGPGVTVDLLARHQTCAGCVVWDEIDKAGTSDWNGDPLHVLMQLLEPESNRALYDDFLQTTVNLSLVSHIATANSTGTLPPPLLSRFRIVELQRPPRAIVDHIVESLRAALARRLSVPLERVPVLGEVSLARMTHGMGQEVDLRLLRRRYEAEVTRQLRLQSSPRFAPVC